MTVAGATVTQPGDSTINFGMRASGGTVDGLNAYRFTLNQKSYSILFRDQSPVTRFGFTSTCGLLITEGPVIGSGYNCYGSANKPVDCREPGSGFDSGYQPLSCVDTDDGKVACSTADGASINNACDVMGRGKPDVWIISFAPLPQCSQFTIFKS